MACNWYLDVGYSRRKVIFPVMVNGEKQAQQTKDGSQVVLANTAAAWHWRGPLAPHAPCLELARVEWARESPVRGWVGGGGGYEGTLGKKRCNRNHIPPTEV